MACFTIISLNIPLNSTNVEGISISRLLLQMSPVFALGDRFKFDNVIDLKANLGIGGKRTLRVSTSFTDDIFTIVN